MFTAQRFRAAVANMAAEAGASQVQVTIKVWESGGNADLAETRWG
jgi:hypothetical protein